MSSSAAPILFGSRLGSLPSSIVPKRLEPVILVLLEDVEGGGGVISVTTCQIKVHKVLREILRDPSVGMLGVVSRYVGR